MEQSGAVALSFTGHVKLTDFGLSRHLPQGARAYTICGTLQYMGETGAKTGGEALAEDSQLMSVTPVFQI